MLEPISYPHFNHFNFGLSDLHRHLFADDQHPAPSISPFPFHVDVKELDTCYVVEADLPGVKKENITLRYENNYLRITAQREEKDSVNSHQYIRQERSWGQLNRSFYIDDVDPNEIIAGFNDGILKITLPKTVQGKTTRSIQIN